MAPQALCTREIDDLLDRIEVGRAREAGGVWLVPVHGRAGGPDADLLEEALRDGRTRVTEVEEGGRVGAVRVDHGGDRILLLLDGEEIVGAKQNRVFNASFLVPARGAAELPVSCVERGRWRWQSRGFAAAERTLTLPARAAKLRRVADSLAGAAGYDAGQDAVWRDVDRYLERTRTLSPTRAYADAAGARAAVVERELPRAAPEPDQLGVAAVRGGALLVLDLFGSAALYARAWRKVGRGLLAEARESGDAGATGGAATAGDAAAAVSLALESLRGRSLARTPAPGCGHTLSGEVAGYVVGAVAGDAGVYHATVAG